MGRSGVIHVGKFQRRTIERGVRDTDTNARWQSWRTSSRSGYALRAQRGPRHEEGAVSLMEREESEILFVDLNDQRTNLAPRSPSN